MKPIIKLIEISTRAEKILSIFLVIGSICGFIWGIDFIMTGNFLTGLFVILSYILIWASIKVFINISYRLKNIQDIMYWSANNSMKNMSSDLAEVDASEDQADESCAVNVGDSIILLLDGKEYEVKNKEDGRICIYKGFCGGYVWLNEDEYKIK